MKYLLLLFLFIAIQSCIKKEAVFELTNSTNQKLLNISIKPSTQKYHKNKINLDHSKIINYTLDMKNEVSDGHYELEYGTQLDTTKKRIKFGYFSNGQSLEKVTKIVFKKDTVLFEYFE